MILTEERIQAYLDHLTSNGASTETVRAYRADLMGAARWIGDPVRRSAIDAETGAWADFWVQSKLYLNAHRNVWAPKTTLRRLGTLRGWAKWSGAPAGFLDDYRPPTPAMAQPHPLPEGVDGVLAMIASTRNPRHRALCALTGLLGLRVGEAIAVRPEHFDMIERTLTVFGKGSKVRVVPVGTVAWRHLEKAYALALTERTTLVRLTNRGARAAIARHGRNAGLSRHVRSHDMRATFGTAAYARTKNLRAVQELLGHADSKTTQVYTGVSMADMRAASEVA